MFFKRYKSLLILGIVLAILIVFMYLFQQIKRDELNNQLTRVELQNVRIGIGTSNGVLGTAIFGEINNKGEKIISIAEMNVEFLNEDGDIKKVHKFFPVNKFSFSDSLIGKCFFVIRVILKYLDIQLSCSIKIPFF